MFQALKNFYHKLGSYPWFYKISGKVIPFVGFLSITLIVISSVWGLFFSPTDAVQGDVYRIISGDSQLGELGGYGMPA